MLTLLGKSFVIGRSLLYDSYGAFNIHRWLTLATRILRLYVSTEQPSDTLRKLVRFIVGHYVPVWCTIKRNELCTSGAKNLFRAVELLRQQPDDIQEIVQDVLKRNAFWAHPEQMLLAMSADDRQPIREEAVQLIRSARRHQTEEVRQFRLPGLHFGATCYSKLITWDAETVTEPPLLRDLPDEDLDGILQTPLVVPPYPVHTQAVERAVRVVTEACERVQGEEARHGFIMARIKHRKMLPSVNKKQDFRALLTPKVRPYLILWYEI